ncbi:alpha/beta hydrolase [Stieleria neptunia]|nr:alpha/beta hydrolase [Stieleria neptunia]
MRSIYVLAGVCCVFAGICGSPLPASGDEPASRRSLSVAADAAPEPPDESAFDVKKIANLRFCGEDGDEVGSAGRCDVYLPQAKTPSETASQPAGDRRWPVVLVVHGGGWATGDKWTMERHARDLAGNGFAAVAINYRHAPSSKFPDQVDDVRSALVWITENAPTYAWDTERVGLYGYSAGGHLVSLVATLADEPWQSVRQTTSWPQQDERWKKLPSIGAVCIGGPPTDFRDLPPDNTSLAFFLGGSRRELPNVYAAASPICFTSPKDPPFQIIHGEADWIVPINNAKNFHRALVDADVESSLQTLPGNGHLFAFLSPKLTDWMLDFFKQQLSK